MKLQAVKRNAEGSKRESNYIKNLKRHGWNYCPHGFITRFCPDCKKTYPQA